MENHPIMIPLIYVKWLAVVPCVAILIPFAWDFTHWYREKNTNSRITDAALNMFRVLLYFLTFIYITQGACFDSSIRYPAVWSQYLLVPVEYAATLPLLLIEGIGGAYNLFLKILSYIFKK